MHRFRPLKLMLLTAAMSAILSAAVAQASTPPPFRLQSVKVINPTTVDSTFSNPLSPDVTNVSLRVFHAPHFDWDVPHSHEASGVVLTNQGRTARVTLDRALHSDNPPCDGSEPRCSDDELPWVIKKAKDIYGQMLSNNDWEVWAVGSGN
ncbi:MAG: hypothetical protein ACRDZ4_08820 [Egibacteraceae bacterium]